MIIKTPIYEHFERITSTHIVARNITSGCVVITADEQTAGIGKRLNRWYSPIGNIYFSAAIPFEQSFEQLSFFSLFTSCAIRELLLSKQEQDIKLHWPNDVYVRGKKVSGILLEVPCKSRLIISIGINTKLVPEEVSTKATLLNTQIDAKDIVEYINTWHDIFLSDRTKIIDYWNANIFGKNGLVSINGGNKKIMGYIIGINENGAVVVKDSNGIIQNIFNGEVFDFST